MLNESHQSTDPAADWSAYREQREERTRTFSAAGPLIFGLPEVDNSLRNYAGPVMLVGEAGIGKSSLALQSCLRSMDAYPDLGVVYVDYSMSPNVFYDHLTCHVGSLTYSELYQHPAPEEIAEKKLAADEAVNRLVRRMRFVDATSWNCDLSISENLLAIRQNVLEGGEVNHVLLVVDLLEHLPLASSKNASGSPNKVEDQLAEILRYRNGTRSPLYPGGEPTLLLREANHDTSATVRARGRSRASGRASQGGSFAATIVLSTPKKPCRRYKAIRTRIRVLDGGDGVLPGDELIWFDPLHFSFLSKLSPPKKPPTPPRPPRKGPSIAELDGITPGMLAEGE